MKNKVSWSGMHFIVALGISVGLAIGGAGGCAVAPDEAVASELATPTVEAKLPDSPDGSPASYQVVYQCFDPNNHPVGLPKSPLSACQAACPPGDTCVRCVFQDNAVECE